MTIEGVVLGFHSFAASGVLGLTLDNGLVVRVSFTDPARYPNWNGFEITVGEVCERILRRRAEVHVVVSRANGTSGDYTHAAFTTK